MELVAPHGKGIYYRIFGVSGKHYSFIKSYIDFITPGLSSSPPRVVIGARSKPS
jgi:hypothetical protein